MEEQIVEVHVPHVVEEILVGFTDISFNFPSVSRSAFHWKGVHIRVWHLRTIAKQNKYVVPSFDLPPCGWRLAWITGLQEVANNPPHQVCTLSSDIETTQSSLFSLNLLFC